MTTPAGQEEVRAVRRQVVARLLALAAAMAGLMPVLAGCGQHDSTVAPQVWAISVCQAVKPWSDELHTLQLRTARKLQVGKQSRDTAGVKTDLITLLSGMTLVTDNAITQVRAAGVPAVDGGSRIASGFVTALRTAKQSFADGRNDVAALPTDDPVVFYRGVSAASTRIGRQNAQAQTTFRTVRSPRLDLAFNSIQGCRPRS